MREWQYPGVDGVKINFKSTIELALINRAGNVGVGGLLTGGTTIFITELGQQY
jgi:hypothetical protein